MNDIRREIDRLAQIDPVDIGEWAELAGRYKGLAMLGAERIEAASATKSRADVLRQENARLLSALDSIFAKCDYYSQRFGVYPLGLFTTIYAARAALKRSDEI